MDINAFKAERIDTINSIEAGLRLECEIDAVADVLAAKVEITKEPLLDLHRDIMITNKKFEITDE